MHLHWTLTLATAVAIVGLIGGMLTIFEKVGKFWIAFKIGKKLGNTWKHLKKVLIVDFFATFTFLKKIQDLLSLNKWLKKMANVPHESFAIAFLATLVKKSSLWNICMERFNSIRGPLTL